LSSASARISPAVDLKRATTTTHVTVEELQSLPMIIDDSGKQSIRTVRARIRQMKHRWNIGSVVVDNFQLLADEYDGQHEMEKLQRAARQLKDIAKETQVVLIVLSQLTRGSQKEAKHWRFSDQAIYGGYALKQASDMMIALANPGDFLKDQMQTAETLGLAERLTNLGTKYELWKGYVEIG
jgi:replicative DNA helicase